MKTTNHLLLDFLSQDNTRFVIPAYQRLYSWKVRQCHELWADLLRVAKTGEKHFLGTLLYTTETNDSQGRTRLAIVDGQQRITTVTLLLVALAHYMNDTDTILDGVTATDIRNRYLIVSGSEIACGKLVLSRNDRDTLLAITEGAPVPASASERVIENLNYFESLMKEDTFDAQALWLGISNLFVIEAKADVNDNAQLIFESLNSKGVPLTTADLVRNYLLIAQNHAEQTRLYDEYWAPIEGMFVPDPGSLRLDNAIQGWLSVRFRKVRAKGADEVYGIFKQYMEDEYSGTTDDLLRELRNFCLVWAENYRYHAVKKYKSAFNWAVNGPKTLVSEREKKPADHEKTAEATRRAHNAVDVSW